MAKMIVEPKKRNVYKYFFPIYKMLKERREIFIFMFVISLMILLLIPFTSANFWDWLTGRATSGTHTVSITLGNNAPNITRINTSTVSLTPVESGYATLNFSFVVTDSDGAGNIDTTWAYANVSIAGNDTRINSSCYYNGTVNGDVNSVNFTCMIAMNFFDTDGTWNLSVSARDISGAYTTNSTPFTYNVLTSCQVGPSSLAFTGVTAGSNNKTAAAPTVVNNTGNDASKVIAVNASNLFNSTLLSGTTRAYLAAENFTASASTGANVECDYSNGKANMTINSTYINVSSATLRRGNYTYNNETGQRKIYYCLVNVSSGLLSGTYDSARTGPWYVKMN